VHLSIAVLLIVGVCLVESYEKLITTIRSSTMGAELLSIPFYEPHVCIRQ